MASRPNDPPSEDRQARPASAEAVETMRRRTASLEASAAAQRRREGPMMMRCAWCDRIALGEQWVPRKDFQTQQPDYQLSHGICPDCFALVKADQAKRHLER